MANRGEVSIEDIVATEITFLQTLSTLNKIRLKKTSLSANY